MRCQRCVSDKCMAEDGGYCRLAFSRVYSCVATQLEIAARMESTSPIGGATVKRTPGCMVWAASINAVRSFRVCAPAAKNNGITRICVACCAVSEATEVAKSGCINSRNASSDNLAACMPRKSARIASNGTRQLGSREPWPKKRIAVMAQTPSKLYCRSRPSRNFTLIR